MSEIEGAAARFVLGLRGVLAAVAFPDSAHTVVLDAEDGYERGAALPVSNLGVRLAFARENVVVLLKDGSFRRPPTSTLYLVEEGEAPEAETIRVADRSYHVLGEESIALDTAPAGTLSISETFRLYPDRRSHPSRAAGFLLPPVRFPELETEPWSARAADVVSASPSTAADLVIRRVCGFAQDPRLATLVLGFNTRAARTA